MFATQLSNAVSALRDLGWAGHLQDAELIAAVGSKLPESLASAYARQASSITFERTELKQVAEFINREAQWGASHAIFGKCMNRPTPRVQTTPSKFRANRGHRATRR